MSLEAIRYPHAPHSLDGFSTNEVQFDITQVNAEMLQGLEQRGFFSRNGVNKCTIDGAKFRDLVAHVDGRGDVIELWNEKLLAEGWVRARHTYQSATDEGVIKAWHLHGVHTDQFAVTRNKIQVVLVDIRPNSPTFGHVNSFVIGVQRPGAILIPPGVMHGWKALVGETIVVNNQTHPYDPSDEGKLAWDCVLTDVWEPKNG